MSTIEFRAATHDEKKSVMSNIDSLLGEDVGIKAIGQMEIAIARGRRTELFLVPTKVMDVFKSTQGKRNPYCLGIYLGDLKKDDLLLSIEGVTLCSPYTKKKVRVTEKGEQAVLYGRDLTRALIDDFSNSISKGDKVVIVNRHDETLALGKALLDSSRVRDVDKNQCVVENILDRGWYLRKGT
jgi:predicted RNA-binding protein (TIGR00451 family)